MGYFSGFGSLTDLDYNCALDGYRRHVWGFTPDLVVEQTDAILLLWYMELAGRNIEASSWKCDTICDGGNLPRRGFQRS